ncbi:hypothetical protein METBISCDRAFT_16699 [Metschnikowia bicuspidata]|uniref:Uncharacterized protein n=1 Tax=Metschnikowia bicuspidata TaxID=27322 RepID=A0A4P9ZBN7_9ASCO|nr:hypothetical protein METBISCDRAFT_16699 [Metschnikowia bicuspidata]
MSNSNTSNTSTPRKPATSAAPDLVCIVQTLQFTWFVGHVVTLVSLAFFLSYVGMFRNACAFWYKAALFGVVESFGVLVYQTISKKGVSVTQLPRDDNVQYLVLAVVLFVYSPYVALTLCTFVLFSTFHVFSYLKHYLLPALGVSESNAVCVRMGEFIAANNNSSIVLASVLEVYTTVWMLLRVLTFRKGSLVPFLAYAVFLKLRFEKSQFTRNAVKSVELKVDDVVNMSCQPALKDNWVKVKGVFHRIGAISLTGESRQKAT